MAKIRNFQLPPDLAEALALSVADLPEQEVLSWGRECLPGGFTKYEAIRDRLAARMRGEGALDANVLNMLEAGLPYRELVAAYSLTALQVLYLHLAVVAGREPVLLAMLVDSREQVHKWAAEQALKPAEPDPTEQEFVIAQDFIRSFIYDSIVIPLDLPFEEDAPEEPPPREVLDSIHDSLVRSLSEEAALQRKSNERLQNELHAQKQRHELRLKQQAEAAERDQKSLREEIKTLQARQAALEKEKHGLAAQLKEAQARADATVAERVKQQTSALVRKWLQEPLEIQANVGEVQASGTRLLERAEQVLQAQARQDRHTGNRLELEARLQQLKTIRQRLAAALASALVPLPDVKQVLGEVEHEAGRLDQLLHGAAPVSELSAHLLTAINAARTWEEVRGWSHMADQLESSGLLNREQARPVYNAVQRKFSLLQELDRGKVQEGDSGWSLRDTLYRNKSALLLIDGHNLLFGLHDIFGPDYENGAPRLKARAKLVELVSRLVKDRLNVRTRICFDGPDPGSHPVARNLEVIYSGGTGKDRADELIVANLQFKDLQRVDQKVFVVTDDREVRRGIVRTGAKYVPANLFAVFLQDFKCLQ